MDAVLHMEVDVTPIRGSRSTGGAGPGAIAGGTTTTLLCRVHNSRVVPNRSEPDGRGGPDLPTAPRLTGRTPSCICASRSAARPDRRLLRHPFGARGSRAERMPPCRCRGNRRTAGSRARPHPAARSRAWCPLFPVSLPGERFRGHLSVIAENASPRPAGRVTGRPPEQGPRPVPGRGPGGRGPRRAGLTRRRRPRSAAPLQDRTPRPGPPAQRPATPPPCTAVPCRVERGPHGHRPAGRYAISTRSSCASVPGAPCHSTSEMSRAYSSSRSRSLRALTSSSASSVMAKRPLPDVRMIQGSP